MVSPYKLLTKTLLCCPGQQNSQSCNHSDLESNLDSPSSAASCYSVSCLLVFFYTYDFKLFFVLIILVTSIQSLYDKWPFFQTLMMLHCRQNLNNKEKITGIAVVVKWCFSRKCFSLIHYSLTKFNYYKDFQLGNIFYCLSVRRMFK